MRHLAMFVMGLLVGIPIVFLLHFIAKKFIVAGRCLTNMDNGKICLGKQSKICFDDLCSRHCHTLHKDICQP